jgi:cytochrome P450
MRRQKFRHAFTSSSLRNYEDKMSQLVAKLTEKLQSATETKDIIYLDSLFGQFSMEVIFSLGFEMEMNLLDNYDYWNVRHNHAYEVVFI